jgi:hypothetical protein
VCASSDFKETSLLCTPRQCRHGLVFLSDGFAGDGSGKVYSVAFDSLGWGADPDIKILDNSHDAVEICPQPVHIWKEGSPKGAFMGYRCTLYK